MILYILTMQNKLPFNHIDRYGLTLRLVEPEDSEFILALRNDESLGRYISATSLKLEDQVNWIKQYKIRESQGLEYYFITLGPNGERWGTTRLSELNGDCFELGSWLFSSEAPFGVAIKADIITKEIGFDTLNFNACKFNVRKENKSVLKYHSHYHPTIINEDEVDICFKLSAEGFRKVKTRFIKLL